MKKILLFIFALMFMVRPVNAQSSTESSYIEVRGTAEKTVAPDKITMSITIREKDYRNLSLQDLEKEMKSSLRRADIDIDKNLKVADMSSYFQKQRARTPDALLSKEYYLHLKDAATAGKVMDVLEGIGISNVSITKAEYSSIDSLKMAIKAEAVTNARHSALVMVEALGQSLGPAFYIIEHEVSSNSYPRIMLTKSTAASNADSAEDISELDFEDIKVTCKVTVRFRLLYQ